LLASGEAAMELCGSWLPNELKNQVSEDFEWGTFPFPEISGGVGKITDMESYLIGWAAFNDTKVGPEIVDFLKFCTTVDNQQMLVDETWNMSTILGTNIPPAIQGLGEALLDSKALFSPHDGIPELYPDYHKNIYLKNHNLAFLGEITPDEYIELMKKETIAYWESQ
jgi:raffinose/stachyose/melibiose transport system substrate-binding protein